MQSLRPRHYEMIRLAFLGVKQVDIAAKMGITQAALSCILSSPLAKAELAKLNHEANKNITNVVDRANVLRELNGAAVEAVRINRGLMNDSNVDVKLRARIGMHFQDRVIFNQMETPDQTSYREILRSLTKIEEGLQQGTLVLPEKIETNGHQNGSGEAA